MAEPRALIIAFPSAYDQTLYRSQRLAEAIERSGERAHVFEVRKDVKDQAQLLKAELQAPTSYVVTMDFGWGGAIEGLSYSEIAQAPHLIWQQTHPASHYDAVRRSRGVTAALLSDEDRIRFLTLRLKHIRAIREKMVLPFGIAPIEPAAEKDIDILFVGTAPLMREPDYDRLDLDMRDIVADMYDRRLAGESLLDCALNALDIDETVKLTKKQGGIINYIGQIATTARNMRRFKLLQALAKKKVPMLLAGKGWQKIGYRFKPAQIQETDKAEDMVDLVQRARIVINMDGMAENGPRDRSLAALSAGAAVIDDLPLPGDPDPHAGRLSIDALVDRCLTLLHDESTRRHYADRGRSVVMEQHLWDHRVPALRRVAEDVGGPDAFALPEMSAL